MSRTQRTRYQCVFSLFVAACATEAPDADVPPVGGAGAVKQAIAGPHPTEQPPLAAPPVQRQAFAVPSNPLRFGETVVQPSFDLECKQVCNAGAMKFRLEGTFRIDDPVLTYYQRKHVAQSDSSSRRRWDRFRVRTDDA
jgi:hypothetical protein